MPESDQLWVAYSAHHDVNIRGREFPADTFPALVARVMSIRKQKLIAVAADPRLSYGEVVTDLGKLQSATPSLIIVLATARLAGPTDAADKTAVDFKYIPLCTSAEYGTYL